MKLIVLLGLLPCVACLDTAAPAVPTVPEVIADTAPALEAGPATGTFGPDSVPEPDEPEVVEGREVVQTDGSLALTLGGWTMEPGRETTRCIDVRLPNDKKIWVPRIRTNLSKGSHHFVVYRSDSRQERRQPYVCTPLLDTLYGNTVPLLITQKREEVLELPPGVAFELEPNQMIRLEAHYLNYYTEPITAEATVTFELMPEGQVPIVADFMFYGTSDFKLPAGEEYSTRWRFMPVPPGINVFALTGHTHQLGTNVQIEYTTFTTEGELVYPPEDEPFKWSEAPVSYFDPPLAFDGEYAFNLKCTWHNTTDRDVYFGESANNEMCFFWAYYYPSRGFLLHFPEF